MLKIIILDVVENGNIMNYWLEKTYSHKRIYEEKYKFTKYLLSPQLSANGKRYYEYMKQVAVDDIVLHLDTSIGILIGYSSVAKQYEEVQYNGVDSYIVQLKDFTPFNNKFVIYDFLDYELLHAKLNVIRERGDDSVFYTNKFKLRQGAYLTAVPEELYNLMSNYFNFSNSATEENTAYLDLCAQYASELCKWSTRNTSITVIIGKNGAYKSYTLKAIAEKYIRDNCKVIAIQMSNLGRFHEIISDNDNDDAYRLDVENNFRLLKVTQNTNELKSFIIDIFQNCNTDQINQLFDLLSQIGFDKKIFYRTSTNENIQEASFETTIDLSNNTQIIEVSFCKKSEKISIHGLSSGEFSILTAFLYLIQYTERNSVVLIDEPENTLHVEWQQKYIKILYRFFQKMNIHFFVVTHSPLIISRLSVDGQEDINIKIYNFNGQAIDKPLERNVLCQEELLLENFGILTPKNHSLSQKVVGLLNNLKKENYEDFKAQINDYKTISYDSIQQKSLDHILQLASAIMIDEKDA